VEAGVADPEPAGHRPGHGLFERRGSLGSHDAADVVRAGVAHGLHRDTNVLARQQRVTIDPDHHRVPGGRQSGVQTGRSAAGRVRIAHRTDPRIGGGQLGGDLVGAVPGRPQGNHQFQRA
jgi:hypothetical protein